MTGLLLRQRWVLHILVSWFVGSDSIRIQKIFLTTWWTYEWGRNMWTDYRDCKQQHSPPTKCVDPWWADLTWPLFLLTMRPSPRLMMPLHFLNPLCFWLIYPLGPVPTSVVITFQTTARQLLCFPWVLKSIVFVLISWEFQAMYLDHIDPALSPNSCCICLPLFPTPLPCFLSP